MSKCKECIHYNEGDYCFNNCYGKDMFIKDNEPLNVKPFAEAELNSDGFLINKIVKGWFTK